MIDVLFKVLGSGLALWESKEKRKYIDELIGLERAYYEEYNKRLLTMLVLMLFVLSCSLLAKRLVPRLEMRTLRISKDFSGFEYRYCKKRSFFGKKCKKWHIDKYDLNNVSVRNKLINMGFKLRVLKR